MELQEEKVPIIGAEFITTEYELKRIDTISFGLDIGAETGIQQKLCFVTRDLVGTREVLIPCPPQTESLQIREKAYGWASNIPVLYAETPMMTKILSDVCSRDTARSYLWGIDCAVIGHPGDGYVTKPERHSTNR